MKVERFTTQACCGQTAIIFKIDRPLSQKHIDFLSKNEFIEAKHFTLAGILYMTNFDFILNGPLGSDRLTVKCKHKESECVEKLNDLEGLLRQIG